MWAFRRNCEGRCGVPQVLARIEACRVFEAVLVARLPTGCHGMPGASVSGRSSGVEHNLAKVGVEGSNPFARSSFSQLIISRGTPRLRIFQQKITRRRDSDSSRVRCGYRVRDKRAGPISRSQANENVMSGGNQRAGSLDP